MLNIAIGLFMVGTLFGMIDVLLSSMDAAHKNAKPAHINLILQTPIDQAMLNKLQALDGVALIEPMNQITVRYQTVTNGDWQWATLVMRPNFTRQSQERMEKIAGSWPGHGALGIERLSAQTEARVPGEKISLETPSGTRDFKISGIIRHPFVKPPAFGGPAYFFADAASFVQFGIPEGRYRQLLVRIAEPYRLEKARHVAEAIRTLLSHERVGVAVTLLQDPQRHWGRPLVAGVNRVLQIMALTSLALSALLVFNAVSAQIAQQTHQIGIMKAIGGGLGNIIRLYLAEVLILGGIACLMALPASLLTAWAGSRWLLNLFNIELTRMPWSWTAIVAVLAGGLLVPLLAALFPVLRGARITARQAMASYGLGADFGNNRFDLWIDRLGDKLLPTLYAAAFGNLFRKKIRLLLTQSVLVIAGVMFLVVMSLRASVEMTLDNEMARSRYDIRIGLASPQPDTRLASILARLEGIQASQYWLRLPAIVSKQGTPLRYAASLGGQVMGIPADSRFYQPLITAGRWFEAGDAGKPALVLNAETAALNQIAVGDHVGLAFPGTASQSWEVIGLYRWLTGSSYAVELSYAPLDTVRTLAKQANAASQILLTTAKQAPTDEQNLADRTKTALEAAGLKLDVFNSSTRSELRQQTASQFRPVLATLLGLSSVVASVGGIGLSGALAIGVIQRQREIGMLKAIGAPFRSIFALFIIEGLFHALLAWLLSIPVAFVLAKPLAEQLGLIMFNLQLDFAFAVNAVWLWLGLVVIIGFLAAFSPAQRAAGMTVREGLSGGP